MSRPEDAIQTIKQLSPSLSLPDLARVVLKLIRDHAGAGRATIFVVDHEAGEIRSIAADRVVTEISMPIGYGIAGTVAETGEIIDTESPEAHDRFDEKYPAMLKYDTKDIYCMPILGPSGAIVGVLQLLNRTRPFTQDDLNFLQDISRQISPALAAHRASE